VELPSIEGIIWASYSSDDLAVIAINADASIAWLQNFIGEKGLTYPFIFDDGGAIFDLYQVGSVFGNAPPTYIIIDQDGVVQYRTDNEYDTFDDMVDTIDTLLED
jgi:peroxiredoxin